MNLSFLNIFRQSGKSSPASSSKAGIFISYRRSDQPGFAGRLGDQLESAFGSELIFRDVDSIAPGENFVQKLSDSLDNCNALLVVIGPSWLKQAGSGDKSRIFNEDDWVRTELEIALHKNKKIFPILVNGATMPSTEEVPESLARFLEFNAHDVSDKRWDYDVDKLIKELTRIPGLRTREDWNHGSSESGLPGKLQHHRGLLLLFMSILAILATFLTVKSLNSNGKHCNRIYEEELASYDERVSTISKLASDKIQQTRLNELASSANSAALNLKTCCIVLDKQQISADQFLQCKDDARNYSTKIDELLAYLQNSDTQSSSTTDKSSTEPLSTNQNRLAVIEDRLSKLITASQDLENTVARLTKPNITNDKASRKSEIREITSTENVLIRLTAVYAGTEEQISENVSYYLYKPEKNTAGKRESVTNSQFSPSAEFTLQPGDYHLLTGLGEASVETTLTVVPGQLNEQTIRIPVGHIQLNANYDQTGKAIEENIEYHLYKAKRNAEGKRPRVTYSKFSPTTRFTVPPGMYYLWSGFGEASTGTDIEVKSGELTELSISIPAGHILLNTVYQDTNETITENVQYYLYKKKKNLQGERETVTYSKFSSSTRFTVPPGKYDLWTGYGQASTENEIEVKSGEFNEKTIILPVGHIQLVSVYEGTGDKVTENVRYDLYNEKKNTLGKRTLVTNSQFSPVAKFTAPPGKYHLWTGYGQASVVTKVTIESGVMKEVDITIPAGHLKLDARLKQSSEKIDKNVSYFLYRSEKNTDGKRELVTSSKFSATARFTAPPGNYYLWADFEDKTIDTEVEITSGETTSKTLIF